MTEQQVVFEQAIDGLFNRALGPRLTPPIRARLKGAGLDLEKKLLPAYAFDVWMGALKVVAEDLFPELTVEEAMFRIGEHTISGYQETFMGRAVLGMIRVIGPKRTLMRATHNFRSANNYTVSRIIEVSPTCFEVWMNEVGPYPTFTAGIFHAAMEAAGASLPKVEFTGHDGHACSYRISWA